MYMAMADLATTVDGLVRGWLPARRYVGPRPHLAPLLTPSPRVPCPAMPRPHPLPASLLREYMARPMTDGVLVLDRFIEWEKHLFAEEDADEEAAERALFVAFPDKDKDAWRLRLVPQRPGVHGMPRCAVPEAWHGLAGAALSSASGVPGAIFAHANGFIVGHTTRDGVLAMAVAAQRVAASSPGPSPTATPAARWAHAQTQTSVTQAHAQTSMNSPSAAQTPQQKQTSFEAQAALGLILAGAVALLMYAPSDGLAGYL